ncbi:hypothetical protein BK133_01185 [Paenibacillus sp. FSL H8-0548]|uniref:AraC family transcriptional regulator n=1 Tax=Paenibacillus sp. FSL H8-0548 TaxID=1920422 RepID=UPI00096FB78E|nr:helix-turn-helix domain-containing protein [Paenibacillus sp. FSL H8-0548]OMF38842.1 hypothetical protein BK133_01185 [Paenibacillus sp. FSL H8-0548]
MKTKNKYKNSFFTRLILSYTVMAVVLIGLAGGYLYSRASGLMVNEIARDSQSRLQTAKDFVEKTVLRKYENHIQNIMLSTGFTQNNANLNFLLDNSWENNLSRIALLGKGIGFLGLDNEGAYNTTVYFKKGYYVVDSASFYMDPDNSKDARFIKQLKPENHKQWLYRVLPDGQKALTYVVKLPYNQPSLEPKGYIFVDVTLDVLTATVSQIMSSPSEKLYVFDETGSMLAATGDSTAKEIELVNGMMNADTRVKEVSAEGQGKAVLSYLPSEENDMGWSYAIMRPMKAFTLSTQEFKSSIFIGCSLVLLFGLIIAYLLSKQFYMPMKKLTQLVRASYQPSLGLVQGNEYTFIGNALSVMGQRIVSLESSAKTNEMKNLVLGANLNLEHTRSLPHESSFVVAHIHLLEGEMLTFKELYEASTLNFPVEIVCLNDEEAAVIFFVNSGEEHEAERLLADHLSSFKETSVDELCFGAAIGSLVGSSDEIPISYQYALQAYRYRFIYGSQAVILHRDITELNAAPQLLAFDQYTNALKAGDLNKVNRFLDEFAAAMQSGSQQLESIELSLLQLVSSLYQAVIDMQLQKLVPPSRLFDELKKESLSETVMAIRKHSEQMVTHVQESSSHAHTEIIMSLKKYIDEHLHEDLSLNVLSELASLAPAYISTLFGEVMKESFTEYVTRCRLDKAADMLRSDVRLSVAEISTLVGYRNPQYFHNKFKTRFGITPVQYRNAVKKPIVAS